MLAFRCWELLCQPVDRRGRCCDDLAHASVSRGFDHLEGPIHKNLESQPRLCRALSDPDRGLVEYDLDAFHKRSEETGITNITFYNSDPPCLTCSRQVLGPTADEVVQDNDFVSVGGHQLVNDRGPDGARTAGHQEAPPRDHRSASVLIGIRSP